MQTSAHEIADFINSLTQVSRPHPVIKDKILFDSGLIILEDSTGLNPGELADKLGSIKPVIYILDNEYSTDSFVSALVEANEKGTWLFVQCASDLNSTVLSILDQINDRNSFTISNYLDNEVFSLQLTEKTRIAFCLKNSDLAKISDPYFLNMFGPVLRVR